MKPRVYLETTIPSYLTAWPSRDLVRAAHQQITREWWQQRRGQFELFISQVVVRECQAGDPTAASERVEIVHDLPLLEQTEAATELAQTLLEQIMADQSLIARGVHGFWPAKSNGDDVELFADTTSEKLASFYFLRQQMPKPAGQPNYCLADFIAPGSSQSPVDYLGGFAVTIHGADELAKKFAADHDDYNAILVKALADRLAEAFAEYLHEQARIAWGYGRDEGLSRAELIAEKYRGIRPAAGYPACPDHVEKRTLFGLLDAENNTGIRLTESYAMHPGSSVSGLYFSHPEAKYFGVGKIDRDQVADYADRRGEPVGDIEKRLGQNLAYDPA